MDFKQIQELIKIISKSNLTELKVEQDNFKITLKKESSFVSHSASNGFHEAPAVQPAPAAVQQEAAKPSRTEKQEIKSEEDRYVTIKSPMIGTFYRSPSPDKEPFKKIGDIIAKGDHICIIEAMKLFNEIDAEFGGRLIKVLAEDATPVEYDQPLFLIDPTGV